MEIHSSTLSQRMRLERLKAFALNRHCMKNYRATLIERIQPLRINVATKFITIDEIFKSGQDGQLIDFKGHLLEKPTITHENTPDNKVFDKLTVQVTDEENVMAITMTALNDNIFREKYEENTRFTLLSGIIKVWEGQKSIQIIARSIIKFERPDVPY
nr:PREDICTED: uncharacterized protein LOC109040663 isoform X2 [Bemisia tabaci]